MNFSRLAVLGVTSLAMASLPACSGRETGAGPTGQTRQADTAPLWYSTFGGGDGMGYRASEVDDAGNAFVLTNIGTGEISARAVSAFDPNGRLLWRQRVTPVTDYNRTAWVNYLRVRNGIIATGGTALSPDNPHTPTRWNVHVYDPSGNTLFDWEGADGTSGGPVDVCGDDSVVAAGGTSIQSLDPSGNPQWKTDVGGLAGKLRCNGSAQVRYAFGGNAGATAGKLDSDGSTIWSWKGTTPIQQPRFDVDDADDTILAATTAVGTPHYYVQALDSGGSPMWSWTSTGVDTFSDISVDGAGNVTVTGSRSNSGAFDFYTVQLDPSGNVLWEHDDALGSSTSFLAGVSLDGAGNAFVCGGSYAILYAPDGSMTWSFSESGMTARSADVTNTVGRCVGNTSTQGIALLAFQLQ